MSGNPCQSPDRPREDGRDKGPVSKLAVAGLIIAVIPLCPFTSLLGALLGIFALRRIRLAEGRLTGRGLALAAVVVGVSLAFVWSALLDYVAERQREAQEAMMIDTVGQLMRPPAGADPARTLQLWSGTDPRRPSIEEIEQFRADAIDRYGVFDRFMAISVSPDGSILRPIVEMGGVFHFADASPFGSASFEAQVPPGKLVPVFRLRSLMIEDRGRGDLTLGVEEEAPTPPAGP
ncbi:MAG: DUF4190 domain-containing protein [Planctomycetota bacterium]|nr:DUF4190 domain-containing protein [Planctomycetota bacterium]